MKWPYAPVEHTRKGTPAHEDQVRAAVDLAKPPVTDVLVIAHGWNNDIDAAEALFTELADNAAAIAERRGDPSRRFAVIGILWPSIRWADDDQIAGGGLSAGDDLPVLLDAINERVEDPVLAADLAALAGRLDGAEAREEFVTRLRAVLPPDDAVADDDPVPQALRTGDAQELFDRAAEAERDVATDDDAVAAPAAEDLPPGAFPDLLATSGAQAAGLDLAALNPKRLARQLLNTVTYYTMKARAGDVGRRGVAPLLSQLHAARPDLRLHLAGHSFGGRVVTMAAATTEVPVASVTLLQAAFSHNGFSSSSDPTGAFRRLLDGGQLRGPVVVTHTHNDKAVLLAYAVASRLAGQRSSGLGDRNDPYGGIGANGAVGTDEVDTSALGDEDTGYTFRPRRITNLRADRHVSGHADVRNRAVANALVQAMLTG